MKKEIKEFCKENSISEEQFTGKEKIGGNLDLTSLTSIPEGFNPTVGGSLYLASGLSAKVKKPTSKINTPKTNYFFGSKGNL